MKYSTAIAALVVLFAASADAQQNPMPDEQALTVQAPAIAQALSDQSGWQVKRVSLKARNSTLAVPDDMATGYLTGQIRGAISLRAPANER
jgi:hypothetical protein